MLARRYMREKRDWATRQAAHGQKSAGPRGGVVCEYFVEHLIDLEK